MSDYTPRSERVVLHCYFEEEARQHQDYLDNEERLNAELEYKRLLAEEENELIINVHQQNP